MENVEWCSVSQSTLPSSPTMQQQFVLNYPLIFILVVVVIVLLFRFMKRRQIEGAIDDGWLEDGTRDGQ
jgi:hypothetical protein